MASQNMKKRDHGFHRFDRIVKTLKAACKVAVGHIKNLVVLVHEFTLSLLISGMDRWTDIGS
jgi:hypothetical protein